MLPARSSAAGATPFPLLLLLALLCPSAGVAREVGAAPPQPPSTPSPPTEALAPRDTVVVVASVISGVVAVVLIAVLVIIFRACRLLKRQEGYRSAALATEAHALREPGCLRASPHGVTATDPTAPTAGGGNWGSAAPATLVDIPCREDHVAVPPHMVCPISLAPMSDPVLCACPAPHSFERACLEGHLLRQAACPLSRCPLRPEEVQPNHTLRLEIEEHVAAAKTSAIALQE